MKGEGEGAELGSLCVKKRRVGEGGREQASEIFLEVYCSTGDRRHWGAGKKVKRL